MTLAAKALVVSHLSPLSPHLRTFSLLFNYLSTLARYDTTYEVRDRARFLSGLLRASGVSLEVAGGAKLAMDEDDFKKGVGSEGGAYDEPVGRSMMAEHARRILFDGKKDADLGGDRSSLFLSTRTID